MQIRQLKTFLLAAYITGAAAQDATENKQNAVVVVSQVPSHLVKFKHK